MADLKTLGADNYDFGKEKPKESKSHKWIYWTLEIVFWLLVIAFFYMKFMYKPACPDINLCNSCYGGIKEIAQSGGSVLPNLSDALSKVEFVK